MSGKAPSILFLLFLLQLLSISSSHAPVPAGADTSPPLFVPRALPVASGTSDPFLFDGVFDGTCAVSYGFDEDGNGNKQCTGVCQQLFSVEYYDAGKGTGFPGATFSRGYFAPAVTCVDSEGEALNASSPSREPSQNDMVVFSQGNYVLTDSVWFGFSLQPPSSAKFSVLQPVKQWPPCNCEDEGCSCQDGSNVLPSRPNLFTKGSFLAYTDGTNYWEFGVLDSNLALLAPGTDPATGQDIAASGRLVIDAVPTCHSNGLRVTYQCYAAKQDAPPPEDSYFDPDTGSDFKGCEPFPQVCKSFPKPDKSGMITLTNPALPGMPMILNASKCLPTFHGFLSQSESSDANTILMNYLNSLSSCFNPLKTPCFDDAMSYLRSCGCIDDDSIFSMIETFCGDFGFEDVSDGSFSDFAPGDDGVFDEAALKAFSQSADPDLAKELATRAADPDKYAEEPPPSDSLGQPLEPTPGGSTISEQCLNNIGTKNLLAKIRGTFDLFSIMSLAKNILLPGRGTFDKDYEVCGSQDVFELSNALAGAPADCLDDALSNEIKLNVAKYKGISGSAFHSTMKSYSLKAVAACSLQVVAFGVPLGCTADVTNCYTNANLIFAPEKGCLVNGSSLPTSSTCQTGFAQLNSKGELGCCVQTIRYPANRGPFSLNDLAAPECATMFLPWARSQFREVNASFGVYGLEVDRVIDWLCSVPGCYTPSFTSFVNIALKGTTPKVTDRCVNDPSQSASGYTSSSAFSVLQATEVPLILSMSGTIPTVGSTAYDNFISVYVGSVAAALNISESNVEISSFTAAPDASNSTASTSKRRSLLNTAKDRQLTVRIKKIAGSPVDTKAAAAKLASNATAVTAVAAFIASAKKISNLPSATAKSAGKPAGARTRFRKVNGPQSVFTCKDNMDCGHNSSSATNTSRGICNLNGFHSAFIKSCVCGHNATGTFVGYGCTQFRPFSNKPFFPNIKTARSVNNTLSFSVSGLSYTTKAAYRLANLTNASYEVTFPTGTTFPTTVNLGFTLIANQPIPSYQAEQGVKSLGGNHIKLLPAGFSFSSGFIQISMKINSPCTPEPGTKHVVMKLISTGGWQAQPTTSNIQVDYKTCVLTFTTSSFSVYGAFNIPLPSSNASGLSAGAIVGIVLGSVFAVVLVAAFIYIRHRRKQNALLSGEPIYSSSSPAKTVDNSAKAAEHPAKASPVAATKAADVAPDTAAAVIAIVSAAVDAEKLTQVPPVPSFTPPAPPSAAPMYPKPTSREASPSAAGVSEMAVQQQARNITPTYSSAVAYVEALAKTSPRVDSAAAAAVAVPSTAPFDSGGAVVRFNVSPPQHSDVEFSPRAPSQLLSAHDGYSSPRQFDVDRNIHLPELVYDLDTASIEIEMPTSHRPAASPPSTRQVAQPMRSPMQPYYSRTLVSPFPPSSAQIPAQKKHRLAQSVQTLQALSRSLPLSQSQFIRPARNQSARAAAASPRAAVSGSSPEQTHQRVAGGRS